MELWKSLRFFTIGVFKRIYWILPTLILDPFEIAEKLLGVSYDVPQWAIWLLFAAGWVVAILLTYHELRMQKVALEQTPKNWIDAHKAKTGKLPPLPEYLLPVVEGESYLPGEPISKNIKVKIASGQFWNRLLPSQRDELLQLVEWLGQDRRDYVAKMENMFPKKSPKGPGRWTPFKQG